MSKELETQREHAGMSEGDHKRFMRRAIELALEGAVKKKAGACFGAVIVKDGEIVGEGHNQVGVDSDPTAHGEEPSHAPFSSVLFPPADNSHPQSLQEPGHPQPGGVCHVLLR